MHGWSETGKRSSFRAVTVNHLGPGRMDAARDMRESASVVEPWLAWNYRAGESQGQARRQRSDHTFGHRVRAAATGDDADIVAAPGLTFGQVENVTKQPPDRRTQDVQNFHGAAFSFRCAKRERSAV
jgi:hypothetical protein